MDLEWVPEVATAMLQSIDELVAGEGLTQVFSSLVRLLDGMCAGPANIISVVLQPMLESANGCVEDIKQILTRLEQPMLSGSAWSPASR